MKHYEREKIRRKQKQKIKQSNKDAALEEDFELDCSEWDAYCKKGYFPGRVIEVQKRYSFIADEPTANDIITDSFSLGTVAKKYLLAAREERNFLVVGDRVLCRPDDKPAVASAYPQCSIEFRAPRTSHINRLDPMTMRREHVLAANVTQLVIVASYLTPEVKWGLIDRFLVLAEDQEIEALLIFNKKDLLEKSDDERFKERCEVMLEIYRGLGYKVISIQADDPQPEAVRVLSEYFKGHISLLAGHSGVGKSSIINLLEPMTDQDIEIQPIERKGRHTTSYARLFRLGVGGFVVDTPGVRSLSLNYRGPFELSCGFREMREHAQRCKFSECQHREEPGCFVVQALNDGKISEQRYRSYLRLLEGMDDVKIEY